MHEEALVRDLREKLEELSRSHRGATIVRAKVAVGPLSHLDERRLRDLWPRVMAGGPAAHARLDVEPVPALDDPSASQVVLRSVTFAEAPSADPAPTLPRSSSAAET
jgi:Zn finger protein HypA/HybF involved in hydrogenase expression